MEDQGQKILYTHFGTHSPYWRLTFDSNALLLSATNHVTHLAVPLSDSDAARIRFLTSVTSSLELTLSLFGTAVHLHLVGRRITPQEWAGTASAYSDTRSVTRDLIHGLSFAEQVVSEANSVIVIVDRQGKVQRFNRLSEEYTGLKEQDVVGKNVFDLFMTPQEAMASKRNVSGFFRNGFSYEAERWIKTVKGERLFLFRNKFVHSGSGKNELFLICSGTDITEERRAQEHLRILAKTDTVTGLPNRNAIQEKITQAITQSSAKKVGVIYLDLDNFKRINDAYGHLFGDRLLVDVSLTLLDCLSENDTLARLGGDEFLIMSINATSDSMEALALKIITRLKSPFHIGLIELYSSCSIGISLSPEHGDDFDSLIRNADTAMYVAKEQGKHTYVFFSPEMNKRVAEYMWLDTNLRNGLKKNQLILYYQPKVSTRSGEVHSVEALVRWNSPERGLIPPGEFIAYAEESGLITPLGLWVLQTAVQQSALWRQKGIALRIAINVSARQLVNETLIDDFNTVLAETGMSAKNFDFELTESSLIEDEAAALSIITQLRELGSGVHMDDFGTGYSSLSQLARIPLDAIKLDQSFVRGINHNTVSQSLVLAIIAVAKALRFKIIAEGVETEQEASYLDQMGVDEKQGYLYARPMPAEALEQWLANWVTVPLSS